MLLTRLGVPRLWDEERERLWVFLRRFVAPVITGLAPSRGYGLERVPASGGAVVGANHLSAIDPGLVGAYCPRPVVFMAKAELLAVPVVGELLAFAGAFPVRRGEGDREAVREARKLVRDGDLVGIFLEGTRQRLGHPGKVLPGGLMIGIQEEAPLVPCGVYSFGWTPTNRRPCALVWGEPIDLGRFPRSGRGYREAGEVVGAEVTRLWRLAAEAVATHFPAELPDGSRRSGRVPPGGFAPSGRVPVAVP